MKKRFLSVLLCLCIALTLLPGTAWAADSDFTIEDGVLTKYNGSGGDVIIPSGVTSIGDGAFQDCGSLTGVTIPSGITSIGNAAFVGCISLTSVAVPSGVTNIGSNAFAECHSLTNVSIPDGVTNIGLLAFSHCYNLTSVNIPDSVTSIGQAAFNQCSSLTNITIPGSVTNITPNMFKGSGLTSVSIQSGIKAIETLAFSDCSSLTSVSIPDGVIYIGGNAFSGCSSLTNVYIPSSVTQIDSYAFYGCNSLTDIYYSGSKIDWDAIRTGADNVVASLPNVTIHYNSAGMGSAGEDPNPKPDPDPDNPKPQEYKVYRNGGYEVFDVSLEECMAKTPSTQYNPQLAHMLIAMCNSVFNNSEMIETFNSFRFEKKYRYEGSFLTYSMAKKQTEDGDIILVVVRGSESGGDWISNFDFATNDDGLHGGFADSANDLYDNMLDFLGEGADLSRTRFVITGFSRGAAVSNILAARLTDEQIAQRNIYAYTFACPDVGKITADTASHYQCIFNIADINDMVSWVPSQLLSNDWYKFGKSYWFCHDWNDYKHISRNFGAHNQAAYMDFLRSEKNTYEYTGRDTAIRIVNDAVMRQAIPGSKANGPYLVIACPVDLKIYSSNNRLIGSIIDNTASSVAEDKVLVYAFGEEKHIFFLADDSFTVEFYGTGTGTMTYTVQNMNIDTWEPIGSQTFEQVALTDGKQFVSTVNVEENVAVDVETNEVKLYVIGSDGKPEKEVLPDGKGTEVPIETPPECDHSYTTSVTAPTCTERGYTTHTCSKCGGSYVDTYTAALGHSYGEWRTVTAATAAASGLKERFCIRCNDRQTQSIPATGGNTTSGSDNNSSSGGPSYSTEIPTRVTGGTVKIAPTSASERQRVAVTVKANLGYELDKLTVTDSKGNELKLTGKGDGKYTFTMPDSKVTVDVSFAAIAEVPTAIVFTDVPSGAYYYDAVAWAVKKGVTSGASATMFSPDSNCTRAQIVTFLWRAAGSPVMGGDSPFTDVASGSYYYDAVQWAVAQGITAGTSATTFSPEAACTRGQAVTFLYRAAGSPVAGGSSAFVDVSDDAYYTNAVRWAVSKGVTAGTSTTTFGPDSNCTRAQIVSFLYRDRAN